MNWWEPPDPFRDKVFKPALSKAFSSHPPDTPAADMQAQLTRSEWADYQQTWIPYENKLIDYATNPATAGLAMSQASTTVNQAFDRQGLATQENLQGLGLKLSADEQHAADRSLGLARSVADVNAQNMARDATLARQQSILGNPVPQLGAPS